MTRKFFLAFAALALLAGCADTVAPKRPVPHYVYEKYPSQPLKVATIQIEEQYQMPMKMPNVEHVMPQPLPQAVADWARKRFVATGADGTLVITIKNASVMQKNLARTEGVKGWFTVDQAERYDAKMAVEFRVDGQAIGGSGTGEVISTRGQTIPENASLQSRDETWNAMEQDMIQDLDASTQHMLREKLPGLLQ